jgi:DNA-binding transcriptional LysR family regulator
MTVIRTGSFADAARHLGYTGSAVSQQIAALERVVKVPLFERNAHSVRPTPAGEFIAEKARDSLAALGSLEDDIRDLSHGSIGRLRLGSFPTASGRLLPVALAAYAQSHPDVEIRLDEGEPDELVPLLQAAELDVALVYRYNLVPQTWPAALTATHLLDEPLVLLLPVTHSAADLDAVPLAGLRDETWISTREGTSGASSLRRMCASADFIPRIGYRSNDYGVITNFVASGLGIAIVPRLGLVSSSGVVATAVADTQLFRQFTVLQRSTKANPAVADAVRELQRSARTLVGQMAAISPK